MKPYRITLTFLLAFFVFACSTTPRYKTPFDTLKAYTQAIKKKDVITMKLLLSEATIQMHQQQAEQQNITIDEIVLRETLFNQDQTSLEYKNEKIEGERATIEVKNSFGAFETVPFVLEGGIWKIDKQGFANQMRENIEQQNNQTIDEMINKDRVNPDTLPNPMMTPDPNMPSNPTNTPDPNIPTDPDATPDPNAVPGSDATP